MLDRRPFFSVLLLLSLFMAGVKPAFALPWDYDMFKQESLSTREIARAPAAGTVPLGQAPFTLNNDEASSQLQNPAPLSFDSAWRGRRLFNSNCAPCHGVMGTGETLAGTQMNVPSLLEQRISTKTDGWMFGVIHNGQGNMPSYGFKFSEAEKWDIVNYLRNLQGKQVRGLPPPAVKSSANR